MEAKLRKDWPESVKNELELLRLKSQPKSTENSENISFREQVKLIGGSSLGYVLVNGEKEPAKMEDGQITRLSKDARIPDSFLKTWCWVNDRWV